MGHHKLFLKQMLQGMLMSKWERWILLDWEGNIVRWFDYPATGTVKYKEPKINLNEFEECLF